MKSESPETVETRAAALIARCAEKQIASWMAAGVVGQPDAQRLSAIDIAVLCVAAVLVTFGINENKAGGLARETRSRFTIIAEAADEFDRWLCKTQGFTALLAVPTDDDDQHHKWLFINRSEAIGAAMFRVAYGAAVVVDLIEIYVHVKDAIAALPARPGN